MKRVIVSVKSTQRDADGEDTVVELVSSGKYYETALAKHIIYDESEVTGLGNTKTTIKAYKDSVVLLRTGEFSMRHEYQLGKTNVASLETPYGAVELAMLTHELDIDLNDGKGHICLGYDISVGGKWQFYNQLYVEIREDVHYGHERSFESSH